MTLRLEYWAAAAGWVRHSAMAAVASPRTGRCFLDPLERLTSPSQLDRLLHGLWSPTPALLASRFPASELGVSLGFSGRDGGLGFGHTLFGVGISPGRPLTVGGRAGSAGLG